MPTLATHLFHFIITVSSFEDNVIQFTACSFDVTRANAWPKHLICDHRSDWTSKVGKDTHFTWTRMSILYHFVGKKFEAEICLLLIMQEDILMRSSQLA